MLRRKNDILRNETGVILLVCLAVMMVLTLLITTAIISTTTDIKITGNYRTNETAFYAAEAGMEEARTRLRGSNSDASYVGDPATSPDVLWSAYVLSSSAWAITDDPKYNAGSRNYVPVAANHTSTTFAPNSLQANISYMVKIKHKTEYDAEREGHTTATPHYYDGDGDTSTHTAASPGNIIYYGYGNPASPVATVQFTSNAPDTAQPVELVTALGRLGNSRRMITMEFSRLPIPPVPAAIYARSNITTNGSSQVIDGRDNCYTPPGTGKRSVYTLSPSSTIPNGSPTFLGTPDGTPVAGNLDIPVAAMVQGYASAYSFKLNADTNGQTYGTTTNYVTVYSNTSNPFNVQGLKLQNVTGYGILAVEGDLELGGGFNWNGIVLVSGVVTFNGGGSGVNIRGAVLANQTVTMNGGLDLRYNSCEIEKSYRVRPLVKLGWKEGY